MNQQQNPKLKNKNKGKGKETSYQKGRMMNNISNLDIQDKNNDRARGKNHNIDNKKGKGTRMNYLNIDEMRAYMINHSNENIQ